MISQVKLAFDGYGIFQPSAWLSNILPRLNIVERVPCTFTPTEGWLLETLTLTWASHMHGETLTTINNIGLDVTLEDAFMGVRVFTEALSCSIFDRDRLGVEIVWPEFQAGLDTTLSFSISPSAKNQVPPPGYTQQQLASIRVDICFVLLAREMSRTEKRLRFAVRRGDSGAREVLRDFLLELADAESQT